MWAILEPYKICSAQLFFEKFFLDLITNWEENQTLTANWGQDKLHNNNQNQLCYPCNKKLSFIKQVPNCNVHNLGKTASRFILVGSYMRGFTVQFFE